MRAGKTLHADRGGVQAKTGDEVIVGTGTYLLPSAVATPPLAESVSIHGDFGAPMPRITGSAPNALVSSSEPGSRIEYLEIENKSGLGAATYCYPGGRIERVVAKTVGDGSVGIPQLNDCVIRDSLIRVDGKDAQGIYANSFVPGVSTTPARNLTVIATGPGSIGIRVIYSDFVTNGSYTLDLRNSIVDAATADLVTLNGLKGPGKISVANSSFDTIKQEPGSTIDLGPGNQTAAPLFVDAAGGDYREAAGSPTIDAGVNDLLGTFDPLGNPRVLGAAPDIGAYEFVPPPPPKGQIESLGLAPAPFRAVSAGEAIFSAKKKAKAPTGTTVSYSLSAKAQTEFFVERKIVGRKVKGKCKARVTKANRKKKRCVLYRLNKSGFAHSGGAGQNSFKFSGRLGGAGLKPGSYRLVGTTGAVSRSASFKIVK
jgi:hypothetical protein